MKEAFRMWCGVVLFGVLPGLAGAATYYNNDSYRRYGTNSEGYNASGRSYASKYGKQGSVSSSSQTVTTRTTTRSTSSVKKVTKTEDKKKGFVANAGLSHEFASWNFNMNNAGSKLHYDGISWNVLDGGVAYYFGDSTPMQVKVGARYGLQFDETPMIDDDISNNGYLVTTWTDGNTILGYQTGHALSVGTSKSGTQMGFNASFGLTDYFTWGRVKMTPSIGYRYFQHKLKTERNYGVTVDIFEATDAHPYVTCIEGYMGEIQCDPILLFYGTDGGVTITGHTVEDGILSELIQMPASGVLAGISGVSTGGTYYYEQAGTSHEYTTTWAGPYLAMDMEYIIDSKNSVSGGVELGLPAYTSEGNQPYRLDWAHPKSVEDTGDFGDAMHIGLNTLWKTQVAESTLLTLGLTYDYYKVSGATAKTFLNSSYYMDLRNDYTNMLDDDYMTSHGRTPLTEAQKEAVNLEISDIDEYRSAGWVLESSGEVNSIYKAMGIRLGVEMKF